ncbi:MAG: hypothetical protein A2017_20530 [Lentisphaerae bacterium GWF2_44_16]|nr:MAG: hypothetical protein A2017_20530 [Lentisphaerae bacterium GWF2_44_16]
MESITGADGMKPKFSTIIEIPYDLRFTGLALDWISGLSGVAGGARKETDALRLAADETLTFLINSYPEAEIWERICIDFALQEGGIAEIVMTNAGPPVHLDRIPQYDPQTPSGTDLDGLWYFLASEAVDDFKFQNRGRDGWQVVIRKQLTGASFEMKVQALKPVSAAPARRTPFLVRLAVPEDAPGLVDLTYDTYRYSFRLRCSIMGHGFRKRWKREKSSPSSSRRTVSLSAIRHLSSRRKRHAALTPLL